MLAFRFNFSSFSLIFKLPPISLVLKLLTMNISKQGLKRTGQISLVGKSNWLGSCGTRLLALHYTKR